MNKELLSETNYYIKGEYAGLIFLGNASRLFSPSGCSLQKVESRAEGLETVFLITNSRME